MTGFYELNVVSGTSLPDRKPIRLTETPIKGLVIAQSTFSEERQENTSW